MYVKKGCTMGKTRRVLISSFLLVSCVVIDRLMSIRLPVVSIGFKFIPFMFSAMLLGAKYATVIGVTSDIIGRLLFPMSCFFPGFTLSAGITGLLYGLFLYTDGKIEINKKFLLRLVLCVISVTLVVNLGLNTVWIMFLTDKAAKIILPIRFIKQLVMIPVEIIVMYVLTSEMQCDINRYKAVVDEDLAKGSEKMQCSINRYKGIMDNDLFEKC